jgi:hypothetical protein
VHHLIIHNPEGFAAFTAAAHERGKSADFALAWTRLTCLLFGYFDPDNPGRSIEITFPVDQTRSILWAVFDPSYTRGPRPGIRLAGAMLFHESDQTWGIHT